MGKKDAVSAFCAQDDVPKSEPVNEVAVTPPTTCKVFVGVDVPIPTFPLPLTNIIEDEAGDCILNSESLLAPLMCSFACGIVIPIPVLLPEIIMASWVKVPILMVLLENTSIIGIPNILFTENSEPDRESVTENSSPCEPNISTIVEPEPCTIKPLRILNSFAIVYFLFSFSKRDTLL